MPALRRSSPSPFLNLPLLILLLSIVAFLLFFLAIFPSSHNKLRPTIAVKKSWVSLNVFLVLFAILCGIFARKNDHDSPPAGDDTTANNRNVSKEDETHSTSSNWFDQFSSTATPASGGLRRLKRSSSSYPDLRQESLWDSGDDLYRFFDDYEIRKYQSPSSSSEYVYHQRQRSVLQESNVKEIPVDTYVLRSSPPSPIIPPLSPAPLPPPAPPPPPETSHRRQRQTYRTVGRKEKVEKTGENDREFTEMNDHPSTPPPPPPPPPPLPPPPPPVTKRTRSEHSHWKSKRKKINATKELKMVLISLYHQSKRKKKQKTKSLYEDSLHSLHEPPYFTVPQPYPPPPPPPPPPSVFQSLFRKGSKNKKVYSYSAPPPPPPPPPPRPSLSSSNRWTKRKNYVPPPPPPPPPPAPSTPPRVHSWGRNSTATGRPPRPTRIHNMHEENVNSRGQSPLIPMPPPPPPPPFRVPGFKFRVQGDYVKIKSAHSSRCSSPELDELDKRSTETVNVMESGNGISGPVFCPSPDVNAKADTFIARLRGEWRMEKINSIREKRSMGLVVDLSTCPSTSVKHSA